MSLGGSTSKWLERYGQNWHQWRKVDVDGSTTFRRPHGLVENTFSYDGTDCGGRADVTLAFQVELKHNLSIEALQSRILLAWANLRLQHVLLMARIIEHGPQKHRWFDIVIPRSVEHALAHAEQSITFASPQCAPLDLNDFFVHSLNTARLIDPYECLSRLIVLPLEVSAGKSTLSGTLNVAHEITDGMSLYHWNAHFLRLLQTSDDILRSSISRNINEAAIEALLPPAQEDLYPPVPGSAARQRWFWAILRVLRHTRKPLSAAIQNPVRRIERTLMSFEPKYASLLNYTPSLAPPMNTGFVLAHLPDAAFQNLQRLTRKTGSTLGAACFALVALVMMELHEERHPFIPLSDRQPMVLSFPLNPKPWLSLSSSSSESCILTFAPNFALPFLPSDLDVAGRFQLLLRQCHAKLSRYQKRIRTEAEQRNLKGSTPARLLADGYVLQLDRGSKMLRPDGKPRMEYSPQGEYPASTDLSIATNGVSNVGSLKHFFDEKAHFVPEDERGGLEARWIWSHSGVRARQNEFLVATWMKEDGLHLGVSYDASAMDPKMVARWKEKTEMILLPPGAARL